MRIARSIFGLSLSPYVLALGVCGTIGCSDKETLIDVETPGGQVEVERDRSTGEVDVEATDNN
jgi:hypothetical protein